MTHPVQLNCNFIIYGLTGLANEDKGFQLIGQCALLKDARLRNVIKSIVYRREMETRFISFGQTAVLFYMERVAPLWPGIKNNNNNKTKTM